MVARQVAFSGRARESMLRGVDILANAVRVTLGPKGRNVVLDKSFGAPRITKDGVTVAGDIELEDKFENMGARLVREVASKTSYVAGDGTTTAIVLAASLIREGAKAVAAGATLTMPVQDMFWGARYGQILDPFGHNWGINQQLKEQSAEETEAEAERFFAERK